MAVLGVSVCVCVCVCVYAWICACACAYASVFVRMHMCVDSPPGLSTTQPQSTLKHITTSHIHMRRYYKLKQITTSHIHIRRYYELSSTAMNISGGLVTAADLEQALNAAITCTILAAAGPQRSRMLSLLYKVRMGYVCSVPFTHTHILM